MKTLRRLAERALETVVRRTSPEVREWAQAILREMEFIERDWEAVSWALGGIKCLALNRKRTGIMCTQKVNRLSVWGVITLSLIALITVLTGYMQAPQPDEGTGAHIFQLSVAVLVPVLCAFLLTADWRKPLRVARFLAFPVVTLVLAFGALYYLEHYYYAQHYR